MKRYTCDDCEQALTKDTMNTVTVANTFNRAVELHYCAGCALKRFPKLKSMIGWTKLRDHTFSC